MDSTARQKGKPKQIERHPHKANPLEENASDLSQGEEESLIWNDRVTDLDVANAILFEEANNEFIKEKTQADAQREEGKSKIPQRVFRSFLDNIENDIQSYSNTTNFSCRLRREERILKRKISSLRNSVLKHKRNRAQLESEEVKLREEYDRMKQKSTVLSQKENVINKARRLRSQMRVRYSIPTTPFSQQTNTYAVLQSLNQSIEEKLRLLQKK